MNDTNCGFDKSWRKQIFWMLLHWKIHKCNGIQKTKSAIRSARKKSSLLALFFTGKDPSWLAYNKLLLPLWSRYFVTLCYMHVLLHACITILLFLVLLLLLPIVFGAYKIPLASRQRRNSWRYNFIFSEWEAMKRDYYLMEIRMIHSMHRSFIWLLVFSFAWVWKIETFLTVGCEERKPNGGGKYKMYVLFVCNKIVQWHVHSRLLNMFYIFLVSSRWKSIKIYTFFLNQQTYNQRLLHPKVFIRARSRFHSKSCLLRLNFKHFKIILSPHNAYAVH